jgi:hypothetical protein
MDRRTERRPIVARARMSVDDVPVVLPTVALTARTCHYRASGRIDACAVVQLAPWDTDAVANMRARLQSEHALRRRDRRRDSESVARGAFRAEVANST